MRACFRFGLRLPLLTALLPLTAGCSHYYLPATQLETPEAIGLGGDRLGRLELVGIQSGSDLVSAPTVQGKDPTTGQAPDPKLQSSLINYAFGVSLAVTRELDLGLKFEPFAPLLARAKYQFVGEPETSAARGNFSAAAAVSGGLLLATYNGTGVTFYTGNAALIGGYRFARHHLASLAPFFSFAGISGLGASGASGTRYGGSLGYQYDIDALILRLELTWASGSFANPGASSTSSGSTASGSSVNSGGIFPGVLLGLKL